MAISITLTGIVDALVNTVTGAIGGIVTSLDNASIGTQLSALNSNMESLIDTLAIVNTRLQTMDGTLHSTGGVALGELVASSAAALHTDLDELTVAGGNVFTALGITNDRLSAINSTLVIVHGKLSQDGANINSSLYSAIAGVGDKVTELKTMVSGRLALDDDENISSKIVLAVNRLDDIKAKLAAGAGLVGDNVATQIAAMTTGPFASMISELSDVGDAVTGVAGQVTTGLAPLTGIRDTALPAIGTKLSAASSVQAAIDGAAALLAPGGQTIEGAIQAAKTELMALGTMNTALGNIKTAADNVANAIAPGGDSVFTDATGASYLDSLSIDVTTLASRPRRLSIMGPGGKWVSYEDYGIVEGP